MEPVLQLEGLRYRRPPLADGQPGFEMSVETLRLAPGEMVGVCGPSGCGKSTLVDLLALLRRPSDAGRFALMGRDVSALWRAGAVDACSALRAAHIGVVLQTGGLIPSLSVLDNVMLTQQLLGTPDRARALALLEALDLGALQLRLPAQLSIGQRQRVAIARALAHHPALVLADEPTAALGLDHAPAAMDLLIELATRHGAALLIVSHDVDLLRAKRVPLRHCSVRDGAVHLEAA